MTIALKITHKNYNNNKNKTQLSGKNAEKT